MLNDFNPNRYSVIEEKNKREIVMLMGTGCRWRRCKFCDYHLDFDSSEAACFKLNQSVLSHVTGKYQKLEVINSGSFTELDNKTLNLIEQVAIKRKIKEIYFECHYAQRLAIPAIRQHFLKNGITLKLKCGVETFDADYRERVLDKGMEGATPTEIAAYFDEVCLLFGIIDQTEETMKRDIEIGLKYFDRVCINIMQENSKTIKPVTSVINLFTEKIYPKIKDNSRIDILMENTAFGVGDVSIK